MSPGTISSESIILGLPFLITFDLTFINLDKASADFKALYS